MEQHADPHNAPVPSTPAELLRALTERLDALDRPGAVALAHDAVADGRIGISALYVEVLGAYLTGVGTKWQHGTERVWREHFASHCVRTIVESLYTYVAERAAAVPRRGETVLLVCPPKEEHELGLRMLADRFEMAGYRAIFLGADTPIADIVDAATSVGAGIVALSASTVIERIELRSFVDELHERLRGVRIVLGGAAFTHDPGSWSAHELLDPAELGLDSPESGR